MKEMLTVVKVGGNEVDEGEWVRRFAEAMASRPGGAVVVHGGGKEVSALQRVLGTEPEWRDGLRVTSDGEIRTVSMVLSGVVNKRLVAALVGAGIDALGVSGEDGGLLRARFAESGALGRTGGVPSVRGALLRSLLELGLVPVLSPVSRGPDGGALNVNADEAAAAVAGTLRADELLFLSDVPGVKHEGGIVRRVSAAGVEDLIAGGTATGGMVPKLRAAARALQRGSKRVRIGGMSMLWDAAVGTEIIDGDAAASPQAA